MKSSARKNLPILLLLVAAPLLFFGRAVTLDFVTWDDDFNVYENPRLNPVTLGGVLDYWTHPLHFELYPLTVTMWALDAIFCEKILGHGPQHLLDAWVFHTTNLALHVGATLAVFALLRGWLRKDWPACLGALLFALHPIQVEPVAWVTGGKDVLSGALALVALWQYLAWAQGGAPPATRSPPVDGPHLDRRGSGRYVAASIAFALAVAAKPTATMVPLVAWVLDRLVAGRSTRQCTRALLPWFAASALLAVATKSTQPNTVLSYVPAIWLRPLVAADAFAFYLYKLALPIHFSADYGRTPELALAERWLFFTWLMPATVAALLWLRKDRRAWLAAGAVSVTALAPVLGVIPFIFQRFSTVADRYFYVPMLGPAMALAWLAAKQDQARLRLPFLAIVLAMLGAIGLRSAIQIPHWQNGIALWEHALQVNPSSYVAHYNLAKSLDGLGDVGGAIAHYEKSIELKPDYTRAHNGLALVLASRGRLDEAVSHYRKAIGIEPRDEGVRNNLGLALFQQGKLQEAIKELGEAARLKPDFAEARYHLANALVAAGQSAEGFRQYAEAARLKPQIAPEVHNNWGLALASAGQLDEAIRHYREALRLRPGFLQAANNLGIALAGRGDLRAAIEQYGQVLSADPDFAEAHNNLGIALARLGRLQEASGEFARALRIRPDYEPARQNLARVNAALTGPP